MMNSITRAPVSGMSIGSDKSCSLKFCMIPGLVFRAGIIHAAFADQSRKGSMRPSNWLLVPVS